MDQPVRSRRRALTASTAIAVAAVLATTGLAWGATDVRRAAGVAEQAASPTTSADGFVAIEPVRILDTRPPQNGPIGVDAAGPLMGGQQIDLPLTSPAPNARSVPLPSDTTAVLINVTIDGDATQRSFLTVWPAGTPRPFASADNAEPGLVMPNLTLAKLGSDGGISIYAQQGAINFAIDLVGYTLPLAEAPDNTAAMLIGAGVPNADTGSPGAFYYNADTDELYGPKGDDGSWPGPHGLPTWASPAAVSQGTDDSNVVLDPGTDVGAFAFGPPVVVWTVTGLTAPADYLLDASIDLRPLAVPPADVTIQCAWSNRPGRIFTLRLPVSAAALDPNEVMGSVAVPGSISDGTTADLVCRTGSVSALGGIIEVQAVQVDAHRVNLLDNS